MARFLLLLAPEHRFGARLSAAEIGSRTLRFARWVDALRRSGALRSGARLAPGAARVAHERDGRPGNTGAAAHLGHYFLVEAENWEAALALATSCPGAEPGAVDVFACDVEAGTDSDA